jgi:hypothetical protein
LVLVFLLSKPASHFDVSNFLHPPVATGFVIFLSWGGHSCWQEPNRAGEYQGFGERSRELVTNIKEGAKRRGSRTRGRHRENRKESEKLTRVSQIDRIHLSPEIKCSDRSLLGPIRLPYPANLREA